MPFLWKMGEGKGCMMGNRNRKSRMEVENGIWKSYAGYNEMLCGVTDDEHIFDNRNNITPTGRCWKWLTHRPISGTG